MLTEEKEIPHRCLLGFRLTKGVVKRLYFYRVRTENHNWGFCNLQKKHQPLVVMIQTKPPKTIVGFMQSVV